MPAPTRHFQSDRGAILSTAADPQRSIEQAMLAANPAADRRRNIVVAKITAVGATKGQYAPYDPAGADGTQLLTQLAILKEGQIISAVATRHTFWVRDCEVKAPALVYVNAVDAAQKPAVEAALAVQGIIVRPGI